MRGLEVRTPESESSAERESGIAPTFLTSHFSLLTSRRTFLRDASLLAATAAAATAACTPARDARRDANQTPAPGEKLKKALGFGQLPESMPIPDRFKLAADLGFDGIEAATTDDPATVDLMRASADKTGPRIHSVMNLAHWKLPLTSPDPAVVAQSLAGLETSMNNAVAFNADAVLLVPAVVTPETRYIDAWDRSRRLLRSEILPRARDLGVTLAIENVGNRFLLSPLEFARYVDDFDDPHLAAYFDIGNALALWSYPQDWIRTLGPRIRKMHFKDFDLQKRRFVFPGDGSVDWPAVRAAIDAVGYRGYLTFEPNYADPALDTGDRAALEKVARRMNDLLALT